MSAVPPSSDLVSDSPEVISPSSIAEPESKATPGSSTPPPSYVKLAMRNMVRKGGKSLFHFALTSLGLITLLVGLAYLTR